MVSDFISECVRYMSLAVRLSSLCNVRAPYSGDLNFYTIWYAGHPLTSR